MNDPLHREVHRSSWALRNAATIIPALIASTATAIVAMLAFASVAAHGVSPTATFQADSIVATTSLTSNGTINATSGQSSLGNLNLASLTTASLSGTQTDWNPGAAWTNKTVSTLNVPLSGTTNLNSLVALNAGAQVTICNTSTTFDLTINENGGGTAAYEFLNNGGLIKLAHHAGPAPECATYAYNGTLSRWVLRGGTQSTIHALTITSGLAVQSSGATIAGGTTTTLGLTGATSSNTDFSATQSGTYDCTAGPLTATGGTFSVTTTKSAGANTLTNVAATFSATGGDVNYAFQTTAGIGRFAGGPVDMVSHQINNLATPTISTDAATKAYVDALLTPLSSEGSSTSATPGTVVASISAAGGHKINNFTLYTSQTSAASSSLTITITYSDTTTTTLTTGAGTNQAVFGNKAGLLVLAAGSFSSVQANSNLDIVSVSVVTAGTGTGTRAAVLAGIQQ